MDPERPLLILNPMAGPWWRERRWSNLIDSFLRRFPRGIVSDRFPPEKDAVREGAFGRTDLLILFGGDGTVHRVIQTPLPPTLPLLVLPGGTGNVLSRYLNVPSSTEQVWKSLSDARIRMIRPGTVGRTRFLIMAGAGWDGMAVRRVRGKRLLGTSAYYLAGFRALVSPHLRSFSVRVETGEGQAEQLENVIWVLASLLPPYLGPFSVPTPEENLGGSLTVTVTSGKRLGIPLTFLSFLPFSPLPSGYLEPVQYRTSRIDLLPPLSFAGPDPFDIPVQADGEPVSFFPSIGLGTETLSFLSFT